jgi:hypothetical protein
MTEIRDIENEIRDIINWVSVFDTEYDLPSEVVEQLKSKLEKLATDVGSLGE